MHLYDLPKRETYFGALHCFTVFLTQALNLHTIQANQGIISDMPVKTCLQTIQVSITSLRTLRELDIMLHVQWIQPGPKEICRLLWEGCNQLLVPRIAVMTAD